ncbi:MAG: helix-turn-helix domain-containing protein [Microbacterium sp.]
MLEAAAELFGLNGYKATTIAQIEKAAGLSPGSGGLYRHFPSKKALLHESLKRQVDSGPDLSRYMSPPADPDDIRSQLRAIAQAGLRRLEHERDLNRLLLRDLRDFPDLLAMVRDTELRRVHDGLTRWLGANGGAGALDPATVAAILMGAVSHYWIMSDVYGGTHPFHPHEDDFLTALADMTASALRRG